MNIKGFLKDNKGVAKWLVPAVIGVIAVIAVIIIASAVNNAKKTINLNDYVVVTESGYDGSGSINLKIDWDKIYKDHSEHMALTSAAKSEMGMLAGFMTSADVLSYYIEVTPDTAGGLSNGDVVEYTFEVKKEWKDYVDCKIKYSKGTYKVKKLEEIETYDAFADLEVVFLGSNGEGKAEFTYSGDMLTKYSFSMDKASELSNGDEVTVTISQKAIDDSVEEYEKVPAEGKKTYKVTGLTEPVKALKEISDAQMKELQKAGVAKIKEETLESKINYSEPEYFGCALVNDNDIYKLYVYFTRSFEYKDKTYKTYISLCFDNIGKFENEIKYSSCTNSYTMSDYNLPGKILGDVSIWECSDCIGNAQVLECSGDVSKYIGYGLVEKVSQISDKDKKEMQDVAYKEADEYFKDFCKSLRYTISEDLSYFGDCFTYHEQVGWFKAYGYYHIVFKTKVKKTTFSGSVVEEEMFVSVRYEGLNLLSDGSIVKTTAPYTRKPPYYSVNSLCNDIIEENSEVSGELANYVK